MKPRQTKAVAALLTGATIEDAALTAGVSKRSLYTWLKDTEFSEALKKAEASALDEVGRRLVGLANTAIDTLSNVMKEPHIPGQNVKRLAARDILDLCLKWVEIREFEQRISILEEKVKIL